VSKYLVPIAIAIFLMQTTAALVSAESIPRGTADIQETDIQAETSGADVEYRHGDHCIDGRTF
jgi:hypothetical protein